LAVIPGKKVSLFSKMVVCLSKVGEDLFIEATDTKLIFRTFNQNRSAYFYFAFEKLFFDNYELQDGQQNFRCKILLKSCLAVFKNTHKNVVEKCLMCVNPTEEGIFFEMHCKLGIKKTYRLDIEECEPLQAAYSRDSFPNRVVAPAQIFSLSISNFPAKLSEITLVLDRDHVKIRSFIDNPGKPDDWVNQLLITEVVLNLTDFDVYEIKSGQKIELTFSLKEIKALLGFCEKQQGLSIYSDAEGKPILITITHPRAFEAEFVLATLIDVGEDKDTQTGQTQQSHETTSNGRQTDSKSAIQPSSPQSPIQPLSLDSPGPSYPLGKRITSPPKQPDPKRIKTLLSDDEDDELIWDKDLQRNVLKDADDSDDIPDSQEIK